MVPTIVCVHGFPDLWYGWRYQIGPWVKRGYRVIAPDMLGYGGTEKPAAAEEYSMKKLCDDLAALLDLVGVQRVILIGHDWGSYTAGRFALWHPGRLLALAMLSVPYVPPTPEYISLEEIVKRVPNFGYQLYFANDESTSEIESNLDRFLRLMYGRVRPSKPFVQVGNLREYLLEGEEGTPTKKVHVSDEELGYYVSKLKSMQGPLSYYRTTKVRYEENKVTAHFLSLVMNTDFEFLTATLDFSRELTIRDACGLTRVLFLGNEGCDLDSWGHCEIEGVHSKDAGYRAGGRRALGHGGGERGHYE
ncbi:hypothetical protein EW146_g1339 [Bondarzewia mesenterica]|uniref:AB hydrolase-1 domain-containing protein n=1 Tax=Bondarzewia mesenterica TaxID=1095465 RepID=A0A4S4M6D2_9AGAM|nr:hypothetical protein EW146_g1339 [Bondarzewia mesenterica]